MKIIISPAKKLDTSVKVHNSKMNTSFLGESKKLIQILKGKSILELKDLMDLSDNLAKLNWQRFQHWDISNMNTYKALELFDGAVYEGINLKNFNKSDNNFAQNNLRILSGLYGVLKPNDLILPYRLEMGTKLKTIKGNNLYMFWQDKLHQNIEEELNKEVLINLASNEYSKVLNLNKIKSEVITPVFKDYKNGKLKVVSFYAKRARGEMVNFIIKNKITSYEDLKLFKNNGYVFSDENNGSILFIR
ncbi:peroxide stress protein YaaA [Flavobacteriales bacterium]|nr:peroxide stress protein YaaA [Flavobacteriales bacterium]